MASSTRPSAPAAYGYDQDAPPQYEALQKNAGQHMNYGSVPPVAGYPAPPQSIITVQPSPNTAHVILVGGCPACRIGILQDDYTALGVLCAVLFFPLGILCCLALKQRRCSNCGAIFG